MIEFNPNDTTPVKKASDETSEQPAADCRGNCVKGIMYTGKNAVGEPSYVACPFCTTGDGGATASRAASGR